MLFHEKKQSEDCLFAAFATERRTFGFAAFIGHDTVITANADAVCATMIILMEHTRMYGAQYFCLVLHCITPPCC